MKWRRRAMGKWCVLMTGMALVWAGAAQAASFDCAKAKTTVEKMARADVELYGL